MNKENAQATIDRYFRGFSTCRCAMEPWRPCTLLHCNRPGKKKTKVERGDRLAHPLVSRLLKQQIQRMGSPGTQRERLKP